MIRPAPSSKAATDTRAAVRARPLPSARPSSGSARPRIVACSSGGAFRQISTSPAALMTSGQASEPSQLAPSADAMSRTTTSSEPRPAISAMPRRSVIAAAPMLRCWPAAGSSSQATT